MRYLRFIFISLLFLFLLTPLAFAQAPNFKFFGQPLVPACGEQNVCTACDIFRLLQNLINFGLSVAVLIAIVVLAWGGLQMLLSAVSPSGLEAGKKKITRALTGVVIVLAAWLMVDTLIKLVAGQNIVGGPGVIPRFDGLGPWNEIKCEAPAFPRADSSGGLGGSSGDSGKSATKDIEDWENAQGDEGTALKANEGSSACATFTPEENDAINAAAQKYGVSPERIKAIISKESGGDHNAKSRDNDGGSSYGLMQVRPETARDLDPGASIEKLKDPKYNIDIGTKYYAKLLRDYEGNKDLASAAYNGGKRANQPSKNCASENSPLGGKKRRWECEYDNNAHTVPNRGYSITRRYVPAINTFEQKFSSGEC